MGFNTTDNGTQYFACDWCGVRISDATFKQGRGKVVKHSSELVMEDEDGNRLIRESQRGPKAKLKCPECGTTNVAKIQLK